MGLVILELDGRQFPVVSVICPLGDDPDESEYDRALGTGGLDRSLFIPSENGLLFELDPRKNNKWSIWLCCHACFRSHDSDGWVWLPQGVQLVDGELLPQGWDESHIRQRLGSFWIDADEDWAAETIYRLAHKPFVQPEGPKVKLVAGDYFKAEAEAAQRQAKG